MPPKRPLRPSSHSKPKEPCTKTPRLNAIVVPTSAASGETSQAPARTTPGSSTGRPVSAPQQSLPLAASNAATAQHLAKYRLAQRQLSSLAQKRPMATMRQQPQQQPQQPQQQPQTQQRVQHKPLTAAEKRALAVKRSQYPSSPVGAVRYNLAQQIYDARELCYQLIVQLNSLVQSNTTNTTAASFVDCKTLHVHLSFCLSNAIERLQSVRAESLMSIRALERRSTAAMRIGEKQAHSAYSGDEDDLQLVEPTIERIEIDESDDEVAPVACPAQDLPTLHDPLALTEQFIVPLAEDADGKVKNGSVKTDTEVVADRKLHSRQAVVLHRVVGIQLEQLRKRLTKSAPDKLRSDREFVPAEQDEVTDMTPLDAADYLESLFADCQPPSIQSAGAPETCRLCRQSPSTSVDQNVEVAWCFGTSPASSSGAESSIVAEVLNKHFWFELSIEHDAEAFVCRTCWQKVDAFHQFYKSVLTIHAELVKLKTETDDPMIVDSTEAVQQTSESTEEPKATNTPAHIDEIVEDECTNVEGELLPTDEMRLHISDVRTIELPPIYIKSEDESCADEVAGEVQTENAPKTTDCTPDSDDEPLMPAPRSSVPRGPKTKHGAQLPTMPYVRTPGARFGSTLLYTLDEKQMYRRQNLSGKFDRYVCAIDACRAAINLWKSDLVVTRANGHVHQHPTQENQYLKNRFTDRVKRQLKEKDGLVDAKATYIDEAMKDSVGAELSPLKSLRSTICKYKNRYQDIYNSPTTVADVCAAYQDEAIMRKFGRTVDDKALPFYRGTVIAEQYAFTVFASEVILRYMEKCSNRRYLIDGTFATLPIGQYKQLLVLHFKVEQYSYPFVHALLTRRTQSAYVALFNYIEMHLCRLRPVSIVCDFEEPLRSAIRQVYPSCERRSCLFHMTQAARRRTSTIGGFSEAIKSDVEKQQVYQRCLLLLIHPAQQIRERFRLLQSEAAQFGQPFSAFLEYIRKEWIEHPDGLEAISLVGADVRSNHLIESNNQVLRECFRFPTKFFKFVVLLAKEERLTAKMFVQMQNERQKIESKSKV